MALKTTKLRDAISFALVVGGAVGSVAHAQSVPAATTTEGATNLDRIQVTGSRIRQVDLETAQPVTFVTREDIERQGFQSVADILQNISAVGTPPISRASPLSAGELAGGTYISLRNLGAQRSLVLVNGRRLGITTSGFADVASIPAVAVERIEILKDGASSIYGSDAIAGVINIITRTNFEGATASAYYGQFSEGDGAITKGDFVMGFTGDRGSLTVAAEWRKEDGVASADRPYSAFPRSSQHPTDNWTPTGQVGGFTTTAATSIPGVPTGTRVVLIDGADPRLRTSYRRQDINTGTCIGATEATGCTPGSIADKSNTNLQTDLRTPLESKGLYVDGIFDITENVRFRTNLLYNDRTSTRTVAGFPLQATSPAAPRPPATLAANSYFNPTGAPISNWWRRTWEQPRISASNLKTYRFSGAFEGNFEFADRYMDWDVSYLRNESKQVQTAFGNTNITRLRQAVGPSFLNAQGVVQCGTAAAPISSALCVPFNPFLPFGVEGQGGLTNNTALQNYLFQEEKSLGDTETTVIAANLSGAIFSLPAGDLGFAIGVENRKEVGTFSPDALAQTGESTNLAAGPTGGSYSVDEAYLELNIPILSEVPFAQELSVNAATRYSDFDTFGDTTNSKFGLTWKPVDSLLVRATVADGFRAPTISDLFGGASQTFSFYTDPCDVVFGSSATNTTTRANCVANFGAAANTYRQLGQGFVPITAPNQQTPVPFSSGGNPLVTPETSKSQTIGLVWSPDFVEGLGIALDWWKIRIGNTIVTDSPQNILNDCYVQGITSRCAPELFTRDASLGNIPIVTFGVTNAGYRKAEGFDFDVTYRWATENFGNFSIASNSTYTAKDYFVSTNDPRFATSGVSFNSQFRIRSNLNLGWNYGDFGINWTARYYSAIKEGCTYLLPIANGEAPNGLECNENVRAPTGVFLPNGEPASGISRRNRTGSNTFIDLQVRYETPWDATVAIGANNVFERVGPVLYTQPSANVSYYGGFDVGRFLYMKYTQRF